jgi:hypothetical protein
MWIDNIRMGLVEIGFYKWRALVDVVMSHRVP